MPQANAAITHTTSWLEARADRRELVEWLAAAFVRTRSTFLGVALNTLHTTGGLTPAVETALRSCREREQRIAARYSHKLAPSAARARAGGLR